MTLKFKHFIFSFSLIGAVVLAGPRLVSGAIQGVNVFPNPIRASRGETQAQFTGLPAGCRIQFFNVNGNILRDVSLGAATSFSWDLKNDAGENVASGVFIFVITDSHNNKQSGKIAVVR